mmetsp:Transcript_35478/g.98029  ORF Transcript_35478/g.98029 Transcript_35478/m.98029 type:complete len:252 (+) Transcript_35478:1616-2371(+)
MRSNEAEDIHVGHHGRAFRIHQERREAVHERHHDHLHVHGGHCLRVRLQDLLQGLYVELVWEDLNHALEKILLRHRVLHADHVVQELGQRILRVVLSGHAVERAHPHQVGAHQHAEVVPLLLPLLLVLRKPLLHPHPEPVALAEVGEDEFEGVVDVPALALVLGAGVRQLILYHLAEVIPQEEAAHRVLYAFGELVHVLKDLLRGCLLGLDVARAYRGEQVHPRQDAASVLHGLVQLQHLSIVTGLVAEKI